MCKFMQEINIVIGTQILFVHAHERQSSKKWQFLVGSTHLEDFLEGIE